MVSSRKSKVSRVWDGECPKELVEDVETVEFVIYNFKDRKEIRGDYILSPIAEAHGYKWCIRVYPRGTSNSSTEYEFISCFLQFCEEGEVTAKGTISCKQVRADPIVKLYKNECREWGFADYINRTEFLDSYLEHDGSLIIECGIQISVEDKRPWYPKKLQRQDILVDLYEDGTSKSSDVVFLVGGIEYAAHKCILSRRCEKLHDIAQDYNSETNAPIPLRSVQGYIFKAFLDFVYTVNTPEINSEEIATDLHNAADLYHCVPLKLYIESLIVDKFLNAKNVAKWLLFADSHACALLKEAAMNLFVIDADTVKQTEAWPKVQESPRLVLELLSVATKSDKPMGGDRESKIDCMSVTVLREQLQEAKLDLDGSREILVHRLKTHLKSQEKKN